MIMKTIKRFAKGFWKAYREAVELQYRPYYYGH